MVSLKTSTQLIHNVLDNRRISAEDALELYNQPLDVLGKLANHRRRQIKGADYEGRGNEIVTYIIDRNVNYTNICNVYCKFCNFYRTERDVDSYVLSHEQIDAKMDELRAIGGRQVLMQGGHHPKLGIDHYLDLLRHLKAKYPEINLHAFSPPEFNHFSEVFKMPLREVIAAFQEAGLGSIPGGGGEILVDRVRTRISPLKCNSDNWLEVMRIAHQLGMPSSATMMFGHVETVEERIQHLQRLRDLQDETGGFTAFICWTFQSQGTVLKAESVGSAEYLRMQALARVFLDNFPNVQSSWVTQGPRIGELALAFGANDFGSVMMEENVVSQAGATWCLTKEEIEASIRAAGFEPRQRTTWYKLVPKEEEMSFSPTPRHLQGKLATALG